MGREGFYNSVLVAVGNLVSAILMCVLQAAWLCQRLIDQDYSQNHGSRLKPVAEGNALARPVEIFSDLVLRDGRVHESKSLRHGPRRPDAEPLPRSAGCRKRRIRRQIGIDCGHPRREGGNSRTTVAQRATRPAWRPKLRRAFSDVNLSSGCSEFRFSDTNQNYLDHGDVDDAPVTATDQDFIRLVFTKGYVT